MWLTYGITADGALVAIADAPRGKTTLRCPYCGGPLAAKKGQIKQAHFAHLEATCAAVARAESDAPTLPLYDRFNLELTGNELAALRLLAAGDRPRDQLLSQLKDRALIRYNAYARRGSSAYELTKLGQIPLGDLSIRLFCEIQEPLIAQRLADLEAAAEQARVAQSPLLDAHLADLRIYRMQLRRILSTTLYFLEITVEDRTLYKIGVTTRPIEERAAEVAQELREWHSGVGAIIPIVTILGTWPHRGNVELYFKHRYEAHQHRIGTLTEYFAFEDVTPVLRDLRRMPKKALTEVEQHIVDDASSPVELAVAADQRAAQRSAAIRAGMEQAASQGIHVGRPRQGEDAAVFLAKPTSQRVIAALDAGLGVRAAARAAGVAVNTVRKVIEAREGDL